MRTRASEPAFPELEGRHPCFSTTAQGHAAAARLHLPVSPRCNIACAFCRRDFNDDENRPGVAGRLVAPDEVETVVERARGLLPNLAVVGIAGPGDPLASDHALDAFRRIAARWPDLTLCLSTNGLRLADRIDEIVAAGVRTLTVTVNAVDPAIQAKITPTILWRRRRLTGLSAAGRLIAEQIRGIERAARLGLTVKINTVLIPGLNDAHVGEVARWTAAAGAKLINVIPLIPQGAFADLPAPGIVARHRARAAAAEQLRVFTHCARCRADAVGIPGGLDVSAALWGDGRSTEPTFSHG
jgi:nitrogen fixation protein NifB